MNQKYIIRFTMILFALFLALAGFTTAEDSTYKFHQDTIVTGMVEQEGDNFILQAIDGGQYTITGQDLSDLVGTKVKAGGVFIVENNENIFNVNEILDILGEDIDLYTFPIERYAP